MSNNTGSEKTGIYQSLEANLFRDNALFRRIDCCNAVNHVDNSMQQKEEEDERREMVGIRIGCL